MAGESQQQLVLIVEDDAQVRKLCERSLARHFRTVQAENGPQALQLLFQHRPDVVLLDLTMPGMDGFEVLQRIRELTSVPVIVLSGRSSDNDVVRGLDSGVADYLTKPISPSQLVARIRAVLRRAQGALAPVCGAISLDGGRLVIDPVRRTVRVRGDEVELSATEYRLLEFFGRHPGQVLSHDQILEHVWGPASVGQRGNVKTYVGNLRNKIEEDPSQPRYLLARRGLGYYLEDRDTG